MKKRLLYGIATLLVLILAVVVFLPKYIESTAKNIARQDFGLTLAYDKLGVNLAKLSMSIEGLKLSDVNTSKELLSFKSCDVDLSYSTLLLAHPVVNSITLTQPSIKIEKDESGKFNFEKHLPQKKEQDATEKQAIFEVKEFHIKGGSITVKDDTLGLDEKFDNIDIDGYGVSNTPEGKAKFVEINTSANAFGGKITKHTKIKLFEPSLPFEQRLVIGGVELGNFAKFLPKEIKKLHGKLNIDANISGVLAGQRHIKSTGAVVLGELVFEGFGANAFAKELKLDGLALSIKDKEAMADVSLLKLKNSHLSYRSKNLPKELTVELGDINLKISNISSHKDVSSGVTASASVQKSGKISLKGTVNIFKKGANLNLDAKDIDLKPLNMLGVLPPKIALASGFGYAKGLLDASFDEKNKHFSYKGQAGVQKLSMYESATNQKLVGFDNMSINGIDLGDKERKATIISIVLEGLFADIKIDKQRRLNLLSLSEKNSTAASAKPQPAAQKPFYYSIGAVVLQNGAIKFEDEYINPNFQASLTKISGRITTIKPNMNELSNVQLIGTFNNQGQIDIKGSFIPNPKNFFLTLKSSVRDVKMPSFTTYSSKYIGYEIDSGALGLELDYQVVGKELSSSNKISLFGFNLGNEVESPSAKKLPYKLALAILKDSKGNIDIELPVAGTMDDPDIRSGRVVWKFVSQLILKAVSAPFKLIGSLFGGGEEMGYVEFEYGSSEVTKNDEAKLTKIADMMKQKPQLRAEIEGFVDGEMDFEVLKDMAFDKKLAVQKLKDQGKNTKEWRKVKIEPSEYEKYLTKAYKAELFAKPTNLLGFEKSIPADDMKNLILTHIQISEHDMLELARHRAQGVKNVLIAYGIDASKIVLSESKLAAPEQKEKVKSSRAEIKLGVK